MIVHDAGVLPVVNVDAAFWLPQAVVPGMLERRYGRIVLTTSGYGLGPADDVVAAALQSSPAPVER